MTFDPGAAARPDSGIFGLPSSPDEAQVVLIPVPYEATTSYGGGAAEGPAAILSASRQVDLFDLETGRPYAAGIALLDEDPRVRQWNDAARLAARPVIDAGGPVSDELLARAREVDEHGARLNAWLHELASSWLARGKIVGTIGGDHAAPLGAIRAHAEQNPGLGVLHLDAHADLRVAFEGFRFSHASIMHNVLVECPGVARLVQVGVRDLSEEEHDAIGASQGRVVTFFDPQLQAEKHAGTPWAAIVSRVVAQLPAEVYLSFDIDGLDPALCPHTGTPVPGGLSFPEICTLVAAVARSGRRIVGFDLCEVAPGEGGDDWDGNVAARLLYKMIGWTLWSRRGQ